VATPSKYSRFRHFVALWRHQVWTPLLGGVWTALGMFTFLRDEFFEPTDEKKWRIISVIPHLPLSWWLCGVAVIFALGIFEASFRLSKDFQAEIASLTDNRKHVRIALAGFHQRGPELMSRCLDKSSEPPSDDANMWAQDVERFMHDNLDDS
jgi:hypothetical protein